MNNNIYKKDENNKNIGDSEYVYTLSVDSVDRSIGESINLPLNSASESEVSDLQDNMVNGYNISRNYHRIDETDSETTVINMNVYDAYNLSKKKKLDKIFSQCRKDVKEETTSDDKIQKKDNIDIVKHKKKRERMHKRKNRRTTQNNGMNKMYDMYRIRLFFLLILIVGLGIMLIL